MQVKIDTKEKFAVVTPISPDMTANIAAELAHIASNQLSVTPKNLVLNLAPVTSIELEAAETIASLQQRFYENNASFVICCMQKPVEEAFAGWDLLELLNATPSESEAWDIVQMEEIERELLDGDDMEFDSNS